MLMADHVFASALLDWFKIFPALWAFVGAIVGGIAVAVLAFLIHRKYGSMVDSSMKQLVEMQKVQLSTQTETMALQQKHCDAEMAEVRRKAEQDVNEAKRNAKFYETQLHDKRNEWNVENIRMTTEMAELRARPDVTTLFEFETKADERRETFYKELSKILGQQGETLVGIVEAQRGIADMQKNIAVELREHDEKVAARMTEMITPVVEGMKEVAEALHDFKGAGKPKK